jgi:hypothetical protein
MKFNAITAITYFALRHRVVCLQYQYRVCSRHLKAQFPRVPPSGTDVLYHLPSVKGSLPIQRKRKSPQKPIAPDFQICLNEEQSFQDDYQNFGSDHGGLDAISFSIDQPDPTVNIHRSDKLNRNISQDNITRSLTPGDLVHVVMQ